MRVGNGTVRLVLRYQSIGNAAQGRDAHGRTYLALGGQCRCGGRPCGSHILWQPYLHVSASAVAPSIVGNECQLDVLHAQCSLFIESQGLCIRGQCHELLRLVLREHFAAGMGDIGIQRLCAQFETGLLVEQYVLDVEVVVLPFRTIHQRTALHGHHAAVCLHPVVGTYGTRFQVKVNIDYVPGLPLALDDGIALFQVFCLHRLSVYHDGITQPLVVGVRIEVAGHGLVAHPSRYAYLHGKLSCGILLHLDLYVTAVGITRGLLQGHLAAGYFQRGSVGHEEVHIDVAVLHRVDVTRYGGDEPADVGRAAGTSEPCLSLVLSHGLQRVGVEESTSIERHARNETVVE